jgi:DNA-directed RNA polymerase specialized sigma24 family protein
MTRRDEDASLNKPTVAGIFHTMDTPSISEWLAGLKAGEPVAVQKLWERYSAALIRLASSRLRNFPQRLADGEDVAISVFSTLWRGGRAGRFVDVRNRDELWWLLARITQQKCVDLKRRETAKKRGSGKVAPGDEAQAYTLDQLIGKEPSPELLTSMDEQYRWLMSLLRDDTTRKVAAYRIEGYTVEEIASRLSIGTRSVERKLQLIRNRWSEELGKQCS